MALLNMCGFDDTALEPEWGFDNPPNAGSFQLGRDGIGQCITGFSNSIYWSVNSIAAYPCYLGYAVKFTGGFTGPILRVMDPLTKLTTIITLNGNGALTVGNITSNFLLVPTVWNYIEVSLTPTTGWNVTVKVNNSVIIANAPVALVSGGQSIVHEMVFSGAGGIGAKSSFDDLYFCDASGTSNNTFLNDSYVRTMLPIGNGASSQFTNSAGTSINNYSYVDEQNSSSVDYVGATTVGLEDLYTILDGTHPIPNDYVVHAIQGLVYAGKSDTGVPPNLSYAGKGAVGTVRKDALNFNLGTTYTSQNSTIQTTDPDGNALTPATVNNMQIGVVTS